MDLFETLGLGPRQPEENELYIVIYVDPADTCSYLTETSSWNSTSERTETLAPDNGSAASSNGQLEATAAAATDRVELLWARCTAWLLPYISNYVWNKDPLLLKASSRQAPPWQRRRGPASNRCRNQGVAGSGSAQTGDGGPSCSEGGGGLQEGCVWSAMRFGDAVDDEWWAVWLLLRMTREMQDLSVQVWDNDGQFLLIEAAYALPRWLKPETADNRVWLRRGHLHIIPLPSAAAPDLPASPRVEQALAVLREGRFATASQRVQRPIDHRLEGYPTRARREQQHVARCLLPGPLAAALRASPQLVSALVEAFYLRDSEDMRIAARMRFLPPSLERVPTLLRMTRCHYAQLAAQRFSAPRGLAMPPPDSPLAKAADLGLKLTVAAEIMCARYGPAIQQSQGEGVAAAEASGETRFASDPTWWRFKSSLEANGYFQGNIPGSRRYKELLAEALEAYVSGLTGGAGESNIMAKAAGGGGETLGNPRRRLAELVLGAAAAGLGTEDESGGASSSVADDDDSWLDQHPDRLQSELDRRQVEVDKHAGCRKGGNGTTDDPDVEDGRYGTRAGQERAKEVDADDVAAKLRDFMQQLSGLEGVEASGDATPAAQGSSDSGACGVEFNPERFFRELETVLGSGKQPKGQRRSGKMDDGTDEDEGEEDGETSTEEGSSFFSSDGGETDDVDEREDSEEAEEQNDGIDDSTGPMAKPGVPPASASAPHQHSRGAPRNQIGKITVLTRAASSDVRPEALETLTAEAKLDIATSDSIHGSNASRQEQALKRGFLSCPVAKRTRSGSAQLAQPQPKASPNGALSMEVGNSELHDGAESAHTPGSAIWRQQLDWEVRTATDSDDEDGREEEEGEGDEYFATSRLLDALGVESKSNSSHSSGADSDSDEIVRQRGLDAAKRRGVWQQRSRATERARPVPNGSTSATGSVRGDGAVTTASAKMSAGDGFMPLYDSAMQAELAGTTLAQSFDGGSGAAGGKSIASRLGIGGGAWGSGATAGTSTQGLQPVDLDMNLVKNLLRSYTAQQGNAGPAGNMAAMLGMSLAAGDVED